jgi:hypothetical protein
MAKKQEPEMVNEPEHKGNEALDALVGKQVILALGRPPNMLRVQVRCLWSAFYRVNVFVGGDNASATIANSYFVQASPDGHVLKAEPAIAKQYDGVKSVSAPAPRADA